MSDPFGVLLGIDPATVRSSTISSIASSLASASSASQSYTSFTQSDSSSTPDVSDLSGAPTLGAVPQQPASKTNIGAIAGGVVGGLVVMAVVLGAILLLLKRRRNTEKRAPIVASADEKVPTRKANKGKFMPQVDDHRPADGDLPEWVRRPS
jgi:hypothetical protein